MQNGIGIVRESVTGLEQARDRIRGEFIEMPGLRLTSAQAARLWQLDCATCQLLLSGLVDGGFLVRTRDGAFVRATDTLMRAHGRVA